MLCPCGDERRLREERLRERLQEEEEDWHSIQQEGPSPPSRLRAAAAKAKEQLPTLLGAGRSHRETSKGAAAAVARGNLLGEAVRKIVEEHDARILGVEVHIGSTKIEPLHGSIELHDLTVDNPEGFKSAYLLHADKVLLRVDMLKLVSSLGSVVDIDEVDLENLDVIYEKTLTTSNFHTVLQKIDGCSKGEDETEARGHGNKRRTHLTLHKITICNIGAKVCSPLTAMAGPRLSVADVHYGDFAEQLEGESGVAEVLKFATATLLKSILASVAGKSAAEHVARGASHAAGRVRAGVSQAISGAFGHLGSASSSPPVGLPEAEDPVPPPVTRAVRPGSGASQWGCCGTGPQHEIEEVVVLEG